VRTVMSEMGKAMMGTGEMEGEGRALRAAETAISNPLLDDVSMKGARAVLINVTGGPDMMLFEVDEAVNRIRKEVDSDASIVFGSALSEAMEGRIRVSVVATGIDADALRKPVDKNVVMWPKKAEAPAPRGAAEAALQASPVHSQHDNIELELAGRATLAFDEAAMEQGGDGASAAEMEMAEPLDLGGMEMPQVEAPASAVHTMSEIARPAKPKRTGMFGIFGRRREERVEPQLEKAQSAPPPRAARPEAQATSQAMARAKTETAPAQQPSQPQSAPISPRAAAEGLRQSKTQPGDDLFNGIAAEDKFEIPAFLRRQANTGT
jgi:cell division protein FtsZ